MKLLTKLRALPGVKKIFVASALRPDLLLADHRYGTKYLQQLLNHHLSGQLKIAPEHSEDALLKLMGKSSKQTLLEFKSRFDKLQKGSDKVQYLTYYFQAAHPGCTVNDMKKLQAFVTRELRLVPRQIQIFTPTPSTYSSVMYWTEKNPFTGETLFVEKNLKNKMKQKNIVLAARRPLPRSLKGKSKLEFSQERLYRK
jgi:uncharacterized radical SAM protein YgiQ